MPLRKQLIQGFSEKKTSLDFWIQIAVYVCMGLMFWPITTWLASSTHEQSRLINALGVLVIASVLLLKFSNSVIRQTFTLNPAASKSLYATFTLILIQIISNYFTEGAWTSLIGIPAYACGVASLFLFLFGESNKRIIVTTTTSFAGFFLLSTFMETLDWPLRALAGQLSQTSLRFLGQSTELGVLTVGDEPGKLMLFVNEHPFHVASECNGFGVILSCLLIACLLSIYHRTRPLHFALNLAIGIAIGFALNTLRIIIIVLLAPNLMPHYDLMHEVVGTITYWSALIITWLLLKGPTRPEATEQLT